MHIYTLAYLQRNVHNFRHISETCTSTHVATRHTHLLCPDSPCMLFSPVPPCVLGHVAREDRPQSGRISRAHRDRPGARAGRGQPRGQDFCRPTRRDCAALEGGGKGLKTCMDASCLCVDLCVGVLWMCVGLSVPIRAYVCVCDRGCGGVCVSGYAYVSVCLCVCVYVYGCVDDVDVYEYISICACARVCVCTCSCMCMGMCMSIWVCCVCVCVCVCGYTHRHKHHKRIHTHIRRQTPDTCTHTHTCIPLHTEKRTQHLHTNTQTRTYTCSQTQYRNTPKHTLPPHLHQRPTSPHSCTRILPACCFRPSLPCALVM